MKGFDMCIILLSFVMSIAYAVRIVLLFITPDNLVVIEEQFFDNIYIFFLWFFIFISMVRTSATEEYLEAKIMKNSNEIY